MSKTIAITGCSTGIGRAAVDYFADRGWKVLATMRNPADAGDLAGRKGVHVEALDVTNPGSIAAALSAGETRLGPIDVLVNNAGFGAFGPFETAPETLIDRQIDTNLKGVFNVTRAVLPGMRERGAGVVVNISSIGGLVTMPLNSIYHAVKFAVVGFTEALNFELAPFGVRAKVVCPGGVATDFAGRSLSRTFEGDGGPYADTVAKVVASFADRRGGASSPEAVAEVIFAAATDGTEQVRYLSGVDAKMLADAHAALSEGEYLATLRQRFGLAAS